MRVAFDASSMRGRKTGIGVYTENLICALRQFAPELEIVELDDGAEANQRTDRRIMREQWRIPRLAKRAQVDLLHLTGFAAPFSRPCPLVMTVMDLIGVIFRAHFPIVARFYWSRYLPFTLRFPMRLIALSEHTKNDVLRLTGLPPERVRVIPPGCNAKFHPVQDPSKLEATRAELGLPANFLLFVSTLEPRKGIDTLIDAFARVASTIDDDLVIVGKRGWYWQSFFDRVRRQGVESRVHFIDYVPEGQLPALYNLAHMFVFPSRYEGFGLTPLEAMACGTPVICSNASSLPEVVGDAGVLVAPNDIDGFARAIMRVSQDDGLRAELRARSLRQAKSFSWESAARDTLALYSEMQGL